MGVCSMPKEWSSEVGIFHKNVGNITERQTESKDVATLCRVLSFYIKVHTLREAHRNLSSEELDCVARARKVFLGFVGDLTEEEAFVHGIDVARRVEKKTLWDYVEGRNESFRILARYFLKELYDVGVNRVLNKT